MRSINIANYTLPEGKMWQLACKETEFHDDHGQYYEIVDDKTAIAEMDETAKRREEEKLEVAVHRVNEAIADEYKRLEEIAKTEEGDPILVEGETTAGYFCQMMVDPKDVAKIALEYNYPVWHILKQDYPEEMWEELGRKFGLETVTSIDL